MDEPSSKKPNNNYNKRPMWQWVVLYLIVGAIVYGVIYYILIANNSY